MRRARYQRGSLRRIRRKDGTKVWEYRWRETQTDGTRKRRSTIVGSVEDYPSESLAQTEVDSLRLSINPYTPQGAIKDISVEALVNHYREHEMPDIFYKDDPAKISEEEERKSYSTQYNYDGYLRKWILPRWRRICLWRMSIRPKGSICARLASRPEQRISPSDCRGQRCNRTLRARGA